MSDQVDQFCKNLRIKLTSIDSNIQALKAEIDAKGKTAEQDAKHTWTA